MDSKLVLGFVLLPCVLDPSNFFFNSWNLVLVEIESNCFQIVAVYLNYCENCFIIIRERFHTYKKSFSSCAFSYLLSGTMGVFAVVVVVVVVVVVFKLLRTHASSRQNIVTRTQLWITNLELIEWRMLPDRYETRLAIDYSNRCWWITQSARYKSLEPLPNNAYESPCYKHTFCRPSSTFMRTNWELPSVAKSLARLPSKW